MNKGLSILKGANNEAFYRTIKERESAGGLVELVLKVGLLGSRQSIPINERQNIKNVLGPYLVGQSNIDFFEFIPFARVETTPYLAQQLASEMIKEGYIFSAGRKPLISDVDISHEVSIPDLVEASCSEAQQERIEAWKKIYSHAPIEPRSKGSPVKGPHWNLRNVGHYEALETWRVLGEGISVAVIDTGCDFHHPEIRDRFNPNKWGYNFIHNNDYPLDDHSHGTHVAGNVAGIHVGVAPNVRLYAVKVLSGSGTGSEAGVIRGIEWCFKNDVDIINMSLGSSIGTQAFKQVCQEAKNRGIYVVCAAGNNYYGNSYPAAFPSTISVAAVDKDKVHAKFSNVNDSLDVSAPGVDIFSCVPGGKYDTFSGTSMASPHAAGVIACGLGIMTYEKSSTTVEDFVSILKDSCDDCVGTGSPLVDKMMYGAGHANANNFITDLCERY